MSNRVLRYLPDTSFENESGFFQNFKYAASSMQGWRFNQEDRFTCKPDFYEDCSLFGVFDGHGGSEVAEYLRHNIHIQIQHYIQLYEYDIELALFIGFLTCDEHFRNPLFFEELQDIIEKNQDEEDLPALAYGDNEDEKDSSSSDCEEDIQQPGYACGSTATVVVLRDNTIYVANAGNSRCVLSRSGQAIDLSEDHRVDDPQSRARIIIADGLGRIDSSVNISRAFANFRFKSHPDPSQHLLTAEPFIKSIKIEEDDEFLIIASDGIWNSMSSQEIVDFINIRLQDEKCDLEDICENVFHLILAENRNEKLGTDNMTFIIIKLPNIEK